jgi:membrane-associated phospholipid phosphatase
MGVLAVVASVWLGEGLKDPDGSMGPSWFRMPMMLLGAFVIDIVPRAVWRARHRLSGFTSQAKAVFAEHWTRERITLVVVGLVSFYVTYVGYRNLKNFLPRVNPTTHDLLLHRVDRFLMLGHDPAIVLHNLLGETYAAHVLAVVYLLFLPVSPLSLVAYLVWSRNIGYGYWYATAQCLAWAIGTASYYALPTLGPNFAFPFVYRDLDQTGVTSMLNSLWNSRQEVVHTPDATNAIQSVAGFASLHIGIVLTLALVVQYTVRHAWLRRLMWVYFALTAVSTIYFGWHYIADDIAGAVIAFVSVWAGAWATGQRFGPGTGVRQSDTPADVRLEEPERVS